MVFVRVVSGRPAELAVFLKERGILILDENPIRLVTHLDLSRRDVEALATGIRDFLSVACHSSAHRSASGR